VKRAVVAVLCLALLSVVMPAPVGRVLHAQAPAEPDLTITMYSSVVVFRTLPTTVILAELADATGPKATGEGISDASGRALVQFLPLPGARDRYVRPGDRVSLARIGARTVVVDVPNLTVDADVAGDRIVGTAPAGATVRIVGTTGPGGTLDRTVTADAAGAFALAEDLAPGFVSGSATYDDPSGRRFVAQFAGLTADVTLDARTMRGQGTPGTIVMVTNVRPDATRFQVGAEVVDGTGWTLTLPIGGVTTGDVLTVTKLRGPAPAGSPLQVTAPAITVEIDPARDRVSGVLLPAGGSVRVEAWPITGATVSREVASSPTGPDAGHFEVDLLGAADLGPGWRVRAAWVASPEVSVGRLQVIAQALIGVHTSAVRGIAPPGAPVTVTLRAPGGDVKAIVPTEADDQGAFDARLGGLLPGVAVTIEAGDMVEIAFVAGDPLAVPVPALVARADPDADTVSGKTKPGAEIHVRVLSDASAPERIVTADGDGNFTARFAGPYDLRRPANGTATVQASGSAIFFTSWAAVQVNAQIGSASLTASGPPGRAYTVRLIAPDGKVVATSTGTTYDFPDLADIVILGALQGFFPVTFTDSTGTPVAVRSGDTLDVVAGDDTARLAIPRLEGVVFVEDDILAGRTTPDTSVGITVESLTGARVTVDATSDAQGVFNHDFRGVHDVQYNDTVQLAVTPGGHSVTAYVAVPGLVVDLDESSVSGTVAPNKGLTVTARRGTNQLTETRAASDAGGGFRAVLADATGAPYDLRTGDQIEVRESGAGGESVSMFIPELEIAADSATDIISGRATPGGALVLIVLRQVLDVTGFGIGQSWPVIEPDGRWTAVPIPTHDVRAGTTIRAQYRLASGHMVLRTHVVPLLAVDHGTPNLCGFAAPRGDVEASLLAPGGAALASARGATDPAGNYTMVLRDAGGAGVSSAVSETVRATLTAVPAEVELPEFSITADWTNQVMSGVGPTRTLMLGIFPAGRCPSLLSATPDIRSVTYAYTDAQGRFFNSPLPVVAPGEGIELAFQTPAGHSIFRQVYRAKGQIFIDTDRVTGLTNSMAAVRLSLRGPGGAERAVATGAAGPLGGFDIRFPEAGGAPVVIRAGDVVALDAGGDHPEITVEPLSFDWSPRGAVVGQAPGGRTVTVHLRLGDGRAYAMARPVDGAGRFTFGQADVPPRATWSIDDVVAVRVVLPTSAGHEIVSQTPDFEKPIEPRVPTIYLPLTMRAYRLSGTTVAAGTVGRARVGPTGRDPGLAAGSTGSVRALPAATWSTWRSVETIRSMPWAAITGYRHPIQR
jgi:hypothetical protein